MSTPKSQQSAEQPSLKKSETYKKISSTTKKKTTRHIGAVDSWYNQIPYPAKWRTHKLEKNYITGFFHRNESSELHVRTPSLGVQHWEEEPPEHLALKVSGAWLQELHRTGGNKDFSLKGHTQNYMCTRPKTIPTCWSWRVSGQGGGWLCLTLGT